MTPETKKLIQAIRKRPGFSPNGINLASRYLSDIDDCLHGECRVDRIFDGARQFDWRRELKRTSRTLTYSDEQTVASKSLAISLPATAGACLDFSCIVTTTRKDRDGDVLETAGAVMDPRAPLLWQHISVEPVGKMVRVISQSSDNLTAHCAIIDSAFGRDVAQLVEFGALRISHGFQPKEMVPLGGMDWHNATGAHIKAYDIFEVSVVSVPSNTDAAITAHSRGKLTDPLIKRWAKGISEKRPVAVSFTTSPIKPPASWSTQLLPVSTGVISDDCQCHTPDSKLSQVAEGAKESLEALEQKDLGGLMVSVDDEYSRLPATPVVEGSWEWIEKNLQESAKDYLRAHTVAIGDQDDVCLCATFEDFGIVRVCILPSVTEEEVRTEMSVAYYKLSWAMKNDRPEWTGSPSEVEITATFTDKSAPSFCERADALLLSALDADVGEVRKATLGLARIMKAKEVAEGITQMRKLLPV